MLTGSAKGNRRSRDFTLESLRDVITEVVACFPVYRTYVDEHGWTAEDRAIVEQAIARARRRNPAMESSLFDFFREVMLRAATRPAPRRGPAIAGTAIRRPTPTEARERLSLRDEAAAVHRAGAREGRRGHLVLPLQPAAVAQRGGRRLRAVRPIGGGVPRRQPAPAARLAVAR